MASVNSWPAWATRTFAGVAGGTLLFAISQSLFGSSSDSSKKSDETPSGPKLSAFRAFQRQYLLVYYVIMLADWLQGTNMYTLYSGYGVDVGALFLTGFSSSAVFGTFTGMYVDKFGRRFGCVVYCVLELVVNVLEHFNIFWLLWGSRILGGISTSLLFTTFESWMVSHHRKQGFPEPWLADTFSWASAGNGFVAIVAGLIAQVAADKFGDIGPFQVAIALTALALVLVCFWEENYGETEEDDKKKDGKKSETPWGAIMKDKRIMLLAADSSLFEGSMYTFVFMWVPSMLTILGRTNSSLPTGLVFSSFMCCITLGGLLFATLLKFTSVEKGTVLVYFLSAASLSIPVFFDDLFSVLAAFLLFEVCVGMFFPCSGMMRSKCIPDALQSRVMNLCRLPLNILVVTGTKLTDWYERRIVFSVIVGWLLLATLLQLGLVAVTKDEKKSEKKKN